MQDELTIERLGEIRGAAVYDSAGDKIGKVDEFFYDTESRRPEWISLGTGFFGTKHKLVPASSATIRDGEVTVPYTKAQVKDSPDLVEDDEISPAHEDELYRYYELGSTSGMAGTSRGAAFDTDADRRIDDGGSMTRKEEELKVGTRGYEAGRVRLRKWVEEEPVAADVELTRERAHVQRERIDQPVEGHEFGEEEVEVPLHAEEPVVEKQAVAKERVSVGKDRATDTRTVTETVRKERVDVDSEGIEDVDEIE